MDLFLPLLLISAQHINSVPLCSKADVDRAVVSGDSFSECPQPWGALDSLSSSTEGKEQSHQLCA